MTAAKEMIQKISIENEALFAASEIQVEAFFKSNPSREKLVEHFRGRCANEHMNMVEVVDRLKEQARTADRKMLKLMARQVLDEANHFDMVAQVIEKISGAPVDTAELFRAEVDGGGQAKGARCLEKYEADDELALHVYQFIAEGRAHRVWKKMSEICEDSFIASTYKKISDDERFHSEIGRLGLEKLLEDPAAIARADKMANEMRRELYEVSCMNCVEVPAARAMVTEAYG